MPDAAARKLTGHALNFVNVIVYIKKILPAVKFSLHYYIGCIHRAGLMNIILSAVDWPLP